MIDFKLEIVNRIIEGAKELTFKFGVKSITMDDIARHLAISKKTIYQYFGDKNELICCITKNHLEVNQDRITKLLKEAIDPIDEMLKISEHIKIMLRNINITAMHDLQKYHPQAYRLFDEHKHQYIYSRLVDNMRRGVEQGLYRSDFNIDIIARLKVEEVSLAFNYLLFPLGKFTISQVQIEFNMHFLYGICTMKGYKLINKYKQINEDD